MEFDYELTKEDRKLFIKEFKKNKLVSQLYKADSQFWFHIIVFCPLIILGYITIAHFNDSGSLIAAVIGVITGSVLGAIMLLTTDLPKGVFLYRWNTKGKISLTYENLNIYDKKSFFSFNSLQVKKVFETESFYSIFVEQYAPWRHFLVVIPKKLLKSEDDNNLLREYIQNYANKLKVQKPKFMLYKYCEYGYIALIVITFILSAILFTHSASSSAYDKELDIVIVNVPEIIVFENSPLKDMGISFDIINKIDDKYVSGKSPRQVLDMIKNRKHDINIITERSYGPPKKHILKK